MTATTTRPPSTRPAPASLRAVWPAMVGLSAVFLVELLDNSVLNVALPTISRDLHSSTTAIQWVTGAYAVVFGGLMLLFGGLADRFGRRLVMLTGLVILAAASLATVLVRDPGELIAVRAVMGGAAAMTTPGSMALSFRLFEDDGLRIRATAVISTVGLVGAAIGPTVGGLALVVAPWQALLVVNAPIALLSAVAIHRGVPVDTAEDLHRDPLDLAGGLLGTAAIALVLISPTLFVQNGFASWAPWACLAAGAASLGGFLRRERTARHPLVDLRLLRRPLVSSGLAYQASTGLAQAGLVFAVTLQLQLARHWSPAHAAVGMLPLILTMLAVGPFVERLVGRLGTETATALGGVSVIAGLTAYGLLGRYDYAWTAVALVLISAGMRIVMVTAAVNVMGGLPRDRTSLGAALTDTATEVSNAVGIAVAGTILAVVFAGSLTDGRLSGHQLNDFQNAISLAVLTLAVAASGLVAYAHGRTRSPRDRRRRAKQA